MMNVLSRLFLIILIVVTIPESEGLEFRVGSGSSFLFYPESKSSQSIDLNIYISESSFTKLGVEYHFATKTILPTEHFQQYIFRHNSDGPLDIYAGYVKSDVMDKAEILTDEFLHVNNGVEVNDFLFSKKKDLKKYMIGSEVVEVPAGRIMATHYQKKRAGQTVDFWIADKVAPIGLVKLISTSKKNSRQNYKIELKSLLENVAPTIVPKSAIPLTDRGRKALAKPIKQDK